MMSITLVAAGRLRCYEVALRDLECERVSCVVPSACCGEDVLKTLTDSNLWASPEVVCR